MLAVLRALTSDAGQFVGLDNFAKALENGQLIEAVKQTAIYGAIVLPFRDPAGPRARAAGPSRGQVARHPRGDLRRGHDPDRHPADRRRRRVPARVRARLRRHQRGARAPGPRPDPVALAAGAGDDLGGQRRHLAVDAVRVPDHVRRVPDRAQRIGRGGPGGRRHDRGRSSGTSSCPTCGRCCCWCCSSGSPT